MKQFAVIGLGNFGARVTRELHKLECRVTAIDIDKNKVQAIQSFTHQAIIANATDRKFLENLEPANYDLFIVSTGEDSHASILITLHLKELGARGIIVKANSPDHARILIKVGATEAVIPEEQMAIKLSHSLARPNVMDYLPLTGDFCVVELLPPKNFINKRLMDLKLRSKNNIQIIAIKNRDSDQFNLVPGGDYKIKETDILVILGREEDVNKIKE